VAAPTKTRRGAMLAALLPLLGCATVDPGANPQVTDETFNADFFYCHVEPELIFAKNCGSGLPSDNGGCHFSSAVSAMALLNHPPVACGGGDHPVDPTQIGTASSARFNLDGVSFEMSRDYLTAPLFVRPSSDVAHGMDNAANHPRAIFDRGDPQVLKLLSTWATR
jgi:hypothetical protein